MLKQYNDFCLGENKMNLQLLITKKETRYHNTITKTKHLFAVIDLDKSKQYPQNFVSILPKSIKTTVKPSNAFEGIFGNQSLEMAKQLLEKALKTKPNSETTKAIRDRLNLLDPKPTLEAKCLRCGKLFKPKKRGHKRYPFCYECYLKRYSKNQ
jgi:hypothetical protein